MRSVSALLSALLKVLSNFVGILWGLIALLPLSNFISCSISTFVIGFMDKVFLIGVFKQY